MPGASRTIVVGEVEISELDLPGGGGPTGAPAAGSPPTGGWWGAVRSATVVALGRPRVRLLALVAFLGRGGIIALGLPIVVLPSPIGIGLWVGPTSVTAAGPTPRLVAAVVLLLVAATIVTVAGTCVAATAEVALHPAAAAPDPDEPEAGLPVVPVAGRGLDAVLRVALVRLAFLVPVLVAGGLAIPPLVEAGYRELTLPSDVTVPVAARIAMGAPAAVAAIVATWLAAEVLGGLATRRVVLFGAGVLGAIGAGFADVLRRPVAVTAALLASAVVSGALLVPAAVAAVAAWDRVQAVFAAEPDALDSLLAALAITATFAATVVLAAGAAAWRAALWTAEVLRAAGIRPPGG